MASTSWFFCRLSLIESCVLLAAPCCLGAPLPEKGDRRSNHGRSFDRRDGWVGLSSAREITREPWSSMRSRNHNEIMRSYERKEAVCLKKGFDTADIVRDGLCELQDCFVPRGTIGGRNQTADASWLAGGQKSTDKFLLFHVEQSVTKALAHQD